MEDPESADWDVRGCHVVAPVGSQFLAPPYLPQYNCSAHTMVIAHSTIQEIIALYADSNNGCNGRSSCARPNTQGSGTRILGIPML